MSRKSDLRGEFLVAILKGKSDFTILQEQGWYRIPVVHAPRRWPPSWLAFYQPSVFKDDAYRVRYYGDVSSINVVKRKELFPNEIFSVKSEQEYFQIHLKSLEERGEPIISTRPRRLVFVPTTWMKFNLAEQINDLFDDSPLEDRLWKEFKELEIGAERQWGVQIVKKYYNLDFALFCKKGRINVETDGDTWHSKKDRISLDNQRDNDLESMGWHVLRFNRMQIHEQMSSYSILKIQEAINTLGGLSTDGILPRTFYTVIGNKVQHFSVLERAENYLITESEQPIEID